MSHCRASVTGRRRQDSDRLITADVRQHLRHKTAAKVFKSQRWAVEKFQAANVRLNRFYRCRERKRRADTLFQLCLRNFIANKC
ncbi:hypothetical protein D3C80_1118060 [compost metagenome]